MSAEEYLKSIIKAQGPITVAQYMAVALSDNKHGYYIKNQPFGAQGDFITSPEISQMFGELLGAWCASLWQENPEHEKIAIVELGPGRGTLMRDFLKGTKKVQGFHQNISVHLIEISPILKKAQQETLKEFSNTIPIKWNESLEEIPEMPLFLVANEFLDALPIHQFIRMANGWRERLIGIDEKTGKLSFVMSQTETTNCALIPKNNRNIPIGSLLEICPSANNFMKEISERINNCGGAAIFIDYGYKEQSYVDSLQAVKRHDFHPVLEIPGDADITAHVDFLSLKKSASGDNIRTYGPISQGDFLRTLGIDLRAEILMRKASEEQKKNIASAVDRLTNPKQMGELFKCFAITHKDLPTPAGFADDSLSKTK